MKQDKAIPEESGAEGNELKTLSDAINICDKYGLFGIGDELLELINRIKGANEQKT